ncbi:MAG TPA: alpha-isopropylmalate synthase regulatory domain-containing protein, partial [Streptosporangiaceae bacterium]|nr:alpha-isopropylmalate synthase regulatory domain-containing protein [Streptosporangiaceae bacterium]
IVNRDGQDVAADGQGNGAVNALLQAIDNAVGIACELEEYTVEAVTPGEDAQGQVRLRVRTPDGVFTGHGLATDVVEASARAYLAALSRVVQKQPTPVIAGPVSAVSRWT